MPDRHAALTAISEALNAQFGALALANGPRDRGLVMAGRFLADAIDLIDVATIALAADPVPA